MEWWGRGAWVGMKTWRLALLPLALCACTPASKEVGDTPDSDGQTETSAADTGPGDDDPGTSGSGGEPLMCTDDTPIGGGAWLCDDNGHEHQRDPAQCTAVPPLACTDPGDGCTSDDECGPGNVCTQLSDDEVGPEPLCGCRPAPCSADADCPDAFSCYCGMNARGLCVPSNCTTDADCPGQLCAASQDACGVDGVYCTSPADECDGTVFPCVFSEEAGHFIESGALGCP